MKPAFDGSARDASLRHALGRPFGLVSDESDGLDELPPEAVFILYSGESATVGEMRDFNLDNTQYPSGLPRFGDGDGGYGEVRVGDQDYDDTFELLMTRVAETQRLVLRRRTQADVGTITDFAPSGSNSTAGGEPAQELAALLDAEDWPGVVAFLELQILARRRLLERLRVVAGVHRDGIQNAVDTVQTKRIELLEGPKQESTVEGALMALVVEVALSVIPAAIAGRVLVRLTGGLLELTRYRGKLAAARGAATAAATELSNSNAKLSELLAKLRKLEASLAIEGMSKRKVIRAAERQRRRMARQAAPINAATQAQDEAAKKLMKKTEEVQAIAMQSRDDALRVTAALRGNDLASKAGEKSLEKAAEAVAKPIGASQLPQLPTQDGLAAVQPGISPIPIDVAMKMQVQDFFDGWLHTAELAGQTLEEFAFLARHFQLLPADDLPEIDELLMPIPQLEHLTSEWDPYIEAMSAFRARLETDYELILWTLMYYEPFLTGPQLSQDLSTYYDSGNQAKLVVPKKIDVRMLNYLRLRFFPASPRDPVLVLKQMQEIARNIRSLLATGQPSPPQQAQSADVVGTPIAGTQGPEVLEILRSVIITAQSLD